MKSIVRTVIALATTLAFTAYAQDEDDLDFGADDDISGIVAAEDGEDAASVEEAVLAAEGGEAAQEDGAKKKSASSKLFSPLPYCSRVVGRGEYQTPGSTEWLPIEEKKYYPFGCSFRTPDDTSKLYINFSPSGCSSNDMKIVMLNMGKASFGTRVQSLGDKTREIYLQSGVITVKLPQNMPEDAFKIATPCFTVNNLKGESRYAYNRNGDGEAAQIRCVSGTLAIEGRHYNFPALKPSNEIKIRSSQDQLFTGLYGARGDCEVVLDQGMQKILDSESGEDVEKIEKKTLSWKLSPRTAVRIHRAMPSIGTRMSVTIMTFDGRGNLKNRCAFSEGRYEVNTGELAPLAIEELAARARKNSQQHLETEDVDVSEDELSEDAPSEDAPSDEASSDDAGGGGDSFDEDLGF